MLLLRTMGDCRVIEAKRPQKDYIKDVIRFRELFYFFAWRDILVRYKQSVLGVSWALIRPLITIALFTLIFKKLANFPSAEIPYYLFALSGLVPWILISNCLAEVSLCLLNHPHLLSKVYFPRIIIPVSQIFVQFADFLISLSLLFSLALWNQSVSLSSLIFLPFFIILAFFLCLGLSFFFSSLIVKYRDLRYVMPFLVQIGLYISPVAYGSFMIPDKWKVLYFLNPAAGIIEGFRWSLFGISSDYLGISVWLSCSVTAILLISGYLYFRKVEKIFGDII